MSGQPAGAFDLFGISVEDASPINPPNIIGEGDSFTITVKFKGNPTDPVYGGTWAAIRDLEKTGPCHKPVECEVIVYAESIGKGYEGTLAKKISSLALGQNEYTVQLDVPGGVPIEPPGFGPLKQGLYLVGATVRIPAFPQWVGYIQDTFVQIAPGA